jgi:hypothetical protein
MKTIYLPFPSWFKFSAFNFFGIILINKKFATYLKNHPLVLEILLRHEKTHSKQGNELLWVFFYLFYILEWIFRLVQYRNEKLPSGKKDWKAAYRNISFEREAYANEYNSSYLKTRKHYTFWGYIRLK